MSWKWPHQKRSPAIFTRLLEQLAHQRRVGVADGVGDAHAVGAGVEQRLHAGAAPRPSSTSPWIVQPKAVPTPPSISVFEPGGVARGADAADLGDHVVGRLAQVGEAVRVAGRQRHAASGRRSASMRALGALQVGHQHRDEQAGQRLRDRPRSSAVSASCGSRCAGTKEPTSISRWPAACASRIHSHLALGRQDASRCSAGRRAGRLRGSRRSAGSVLHVLSPCDAGLVPAMESTLDIPDEHHPVVIWNARHSGSETQNRPSSRHARPRSQDPAPARRGLRPPEHRARRRAGAHRAVGDQQAHRPARGTTSARRC